MTVSREKEVSTSIRSFQVPFLQILTLSGRPLTQRKPASASKIACWSYSSKKSRKSLSGQFIGLQIQPQTCPKVLRIQHSLTPTLQRPLSLLFFPNCWSERPDRIGNISSIG